MGGKRVAILVFVLVLQILLIGYFVQNRIVDRDEGLYLWAAREVASGKSPYEDFFFPQMPLLLYLLLPLSRLGWNSLFLARSVYGTASLILGLLIFHYLYRREKSFEIALFGLSIYVFSGFLLSWHTVVQFNALTDLLVFGAFLSFTAGLHTQRRQYYLLAGLLLGLTVDLRIVFIPLIPVFLFLIYFFRPRDGLGRVRRSLSLCLGGALLGGSPLIYFLGRYRLGFLQQTVFFQLTRDRFFWEAPGMWTSMSHNVATLAKFFLFPQTGLVLVLSIYMLFCYLRETPRRPFISSHPRQGVLLLIALTIFASHLVVTPSFFHYWVQVVPLLIAFSAPSLSRLLERRGLRKFAVAGGVIYLLCISLPIALHVKAWMPKYRPWQIANLRSVVEVVQELTSEDDRVVSYWTGFLVFAERRGIEGVNPRERIISNKLTATERHRYPIADHSRLAEAITKKEADLIIMPPGSRDRSVVEDSYREVERFEGFAIYLPKQEGR